MDTKARILDIAMNLNRLGNWAADNYNAKKKRIILFLQDTTQSIGMLSSSSLPPPFKNTFKRFLSEYKKLEKEGKKGPKDPLSWAEEMMTWGNILTHRSKLIS